MMNLKSINAFANNAFVAVPSFGRLLDSFPFKAVRRGFAAPPKIAFVSCVRQALLLRLATLGASEFVNSIGDHKVRLTDSALSNLFSAASPSSEVVTRHRAKLRIGITSRCVKSFGTVATRLFCTGLWFTRRDADSAFVPCGLWRFQKASATAINPSNSAYKVPVADWTNVLNWLHSFAPICSFYHSERKYFDVACERISRAYAQGKLFADAPAAKPEQADILEAA